MFTGKVQIHLGAMASVPQQTVSTTKYLVIANESRLNGIVLTSICGNYIKEQRRKMYNAYIES